MAWMGKRKCLQNFGRELHKNQKLGTTQDIRILIKYILRKYVVRL
jgi:hypothetical protein